MKSSLQLFTFIALTVSGSVSAFAPTASSNNNNNNIVLDTVRSGNTALCMADKNENDLLRWAKASRQASSDDRVVELMRPLGLVLNEDEKTGNVYVETVAAKGNAARSGLVKEGDIVTMCSATFGNQMWSTRGVGLTRVLAAIRVRAGPTVKLALESTTEGKRRAAFTSKQAKAAENARATAQAKKDQLLGQLEEDEKRLKKGKFLGLF
eukprot:CAMPEP_0202455724 /NCGR_PEP_ID=MMETSP1360-20130828/13177_1 /ASSEMBLY_ACC=CAM_ASM_000848 /TAXON_ID=515479 /ORGANISM="Licmophora paradoxa, Strain CCMP2313" /LENGTH=208 /DNA_ID=CAMNT_0049075367 /DNA_START=116 /DNA_END=742 /DNA_ORIENTATION=+